VLDLGPARDPITMAEVTGPAESVRSSTTERHGDVALVRGQLITTRSKPWLDR